MIRSHCRRIAMSMVLSVCFAITVLPVLAGEHALVFQDDSELWLEGDSTLHAFKINAKVLELTSTVVLGDTPAEPGTLLGAGDAARLTELTLTIPVKEMKSHVAGLAGKMKKTLKHKEHPNIVFVMDSYEVKADEDNPGQYSVAAKGKLTLAGVTRDIDLAMTAVPKGTHVEVTGEETVLMTDYDIEPPEMMFGKIKTDNEIVVKWELLVGVK